MVLQALQCQNKELNFKLSATEEKVKSLQEEKHSMENKLQVIYLFLFYILYFHSLSVFLFLSARLAEYGEHYIFQPGVTGSIHTQMKYEVLEIKL